MKAAVLHDFKTQLKIADVAKPEPSADEVLIRVEACGACHSDVHVADGDWPQMARIVKKPLILGHEITGHVVAAGENVKDIRVGDHVGVSWIHWSCGECEFCLSGNEVLCAKQKITGVTVDGGYAEFVKAPATHVVKIPAGLTSTEAAPLLCAGVTVYRALKKANVLPGQRLAIFGVGGLGHLAVQMGREMGAEVTAVDMSDEKLEQAKADGAAYTLNAVSGDTRKEIRKRGGAHAVLVTSAAKAAYDAAFPCVRPMGVLVVVGLPAEPICFPALSMVAGEVRIQASSVGTREDLRNVLAMAAAGKLKCRVAERPLAEASSVLDELRRGQVSGRIVLRP